MSVVDEPSKSVLTKSSYLVILLTLVTLVTSACSSAVVGIEAIEMKKTQSLPFYPEYLRGRASRQDFFV